MTRLDNPMSFKRLGKRACPSCVSSTPSKIPYGGFSPVRLQTGIQSRPSPPPLGFKPRAGIRPVHGSLYATKVRAPAPVAQTGMFSGAGNKDDPVQRSFAPRRVMLSHRVIATMTSSETLGTFRRLICFVLADPRPTALSGLAPRGSPIYSAFPSHRAASRTPADRTTAHGCCFVARHSLRPIRKGSASASPRRRFSRGRVTRLQSSLNAAARRVARPAPTRYFYFRAFIP